MPLAEAALPILASTSIPEPSAWLLILLVFAPAIAGLATLLLPRQATTLKPIVALLGPVTSLVLLFVHFARHGTDGGRMVTQWMPALHLDFAFNVDPLGGFFALLVAGIGCLIVLYGRAYLGDTPGDVGKFYPLITSFMTAMLGLVLADDMILMLLFWEMTSITSFLLIGWDPRNEKGVKNALQAFATTGFGGLALLGGLIWLGVQTGSWSFTDLDPVASGGMMTAAFLLIYGGIAAKSAQWPLHYWLPGAMLAPTPISAYLHSAAMVKAGIYLLARLWPDMAHLDVWPWIVVGFGSITMVLGAWIALQRDVLKQILAYTTISQLGLLACAFGLSHFTYDGKPNLVWGNIQILNHALYKAPLFILAGAVTHAIGPKALSGMVGWWHAGGDGGERKRYALLFLLALVALAALPGTMSFFAKEAFLYQIWHGFKETKSPLLIALLVGTVFTSVCNVAILIRFGRTFFATHDEEAEPHHGHHGHDTAFWTAMLWMPAALLIGLQYVGGLFGPLVAPTLATIEASAFYPKDPLDLFSLWYVVTHPGVPLLASLIGIVIGVVLGLSNVWSGFRGDVHDRIFPGSYNGILGGGRFVFGLFQTGQLRWYVTATTLTIVGIIVWTGWTAWMPLLAKAWGEVQAEGGLPDFWIDPAAWMLPLAICVAALMTVVVRRRVPRVLVIGTVGFAVSGLFYHYAAPDLALTQLSVEIVSLILFLLVLNLLPDPKTLKPRTFLVPRIIVAIAIGTTAGFIAFIASTGERPQRVVSLSTPEDKTTLGDFFLRNSYSGKDLVGVDPDRLGEGVVDRGESHLTSFGSKIKAEPAYEGDDAVAVSKGGGGGNVVNVILVDFRGFDTFGEIGVLGIAAMGVWTLLRKPPSEQDIDAKDNRSEPSADTFEEPNGPIPFDALTMNGIRGDHPVRSQDIASDILKTASWLLLPLALVFAAFLFFKGHQEPGGGFVGGLAAAVALVVFRMCFGCQALYDLLPVRERTMIGIGLLLASLTAVVPLLFGLPLLTSNNGYLPLIGGGSYHWSTVIVFDLGVFLVVVGSIVGMADALARELES